jgi:hypothetical protein
MMSRKERGFLMSKRVSRWSMAAAVLVASGALSTAATLTASASPATADGPVAVAAPSGTGFSVTGSLSAVAASSPGNAWAVGSTGTTALTAHWNGKAWTNVRNPAPRSAGLAGVAVISANDAWAVGSAGNGPLSMHWNGKAWLRVPAPGPAGGFLTAVSASSAGNVWAVGAAPNSSDTENALILHWNGKAWKQVPAPKVKTTFGSAGAQLVSVSALSAGNAWASGDLILPGAGVAGGVILHWNGKAWAQVAVSSLTQAGGLSVSATSASNVWASGCDCQGGADGVLTAHWNGKKWTMVSVPLRAYGTAGGELATAGNTAWVSAVSCQMGGCTATQMILRWTGTAWKVSASLPSKNTIVALAATSPANAWAVGFVLTKTLILHWNGKSWT